MRKYQNQKWSVSKNQRGATAIIVAASMFALVGIAAFVVDLGFIHVAKNELQNAADAGALAGAMALYIDTNPPEINGVDVDGDVSKSANKVAYNTAIANFSQNQSVEVVWTPGDYINNNKDDVQRGHWSFASKSFTPNNSCDLTDLWGVTNAVLDADTDFINAVRVVARRQTTPVESFFSKIFGHESFEVSAEAVGYIGFAGGDINAGELDLPLALCIDSLLVNGVYSCNIGRVINNGNDPTTSETGRWTNFSSVPDSDSTEDPNICDNIEDSVSNNDFTGMPICDDDVGINPEPINGGDELATNNGAMTVLTAIYDCFVEKHNKEPTETPWSVTLPVIECNSGPTCGIVAGVVEIIIVWVTDDKNYAETPIQMDGMRDSEGELVLDADDNPLYVAGGAPQDGSTVDSGGLDSLYAFMQTLDDYNGVEDWNKELEKEFGATWYELPLVNFFKKVIVNEEGEEEEIPFAVNEGKAAGKVRWASFIRHFNLKNVSVTVIINEDDEEEEKEVVKPAPFAKESIYFLPNCAYSELSGQTSDVNFGVLAKIPVLVSPGL